METRYKIKEPYNLIRHDDNWGANLESGQLVATICDPHSAGDRIQVVLRPDPRLAKFWDWTLVEVSYTWTVLVELQHGWFINYFFFLQFENIMLYYFMKNKKYF